jgi:hypothetical protein
MARSRVHAPLVALLAFLVTSPAWAATPVSLPPGEDASLWVDAFRLGDLVVGPVGEGPWIQLTDGGDYWVLSVRDAQNEVHTTNVMAPVTPQDREDTIWLALSLLKPKAAAAPVAPADTHIIPTDKPTASKPVKIPKPTDTNVAAAPDAHAAAPDAHTARVDAHTGTAWWVGAGGGVGWRPGLGAGADVRLVAGASPARGMNVSLALELEPSTPVAGLDDVSLGGTDIGGVLDFAVPGGVLLGATGGVSVRTLTHAAANVATAPVAFLGADVERPFALTGPMRAAPFLQLRCDLRSMQFTSGDAAADPSTLSLLAGVTLAYASR